MELHAEEDSPMKVDEMLQGARDAMTARTVFAEPIERDGALIIPAAKVRGGGGGGGDSQDNGGGGFGIAASPAGAYVVRDGKVSWEPAIDVNRAILGGQIVAIVLLLVLRSILRSRR
jgi:uncharacterized spore protein YtfJ